MGSFTILVKYKHVSLAQKPKVFKLARAGGLFTFGLFSFFRAWCQLM